MSGRIDTAARRLVDKKDVYQRLDREAAAAERAYREEEREFWMALKHELGDIKTVSLDLGEGYGTVQFQRRETITGRVLSDEEAETALVEMGLDDALLGPRAIRKKVLNEHVREWLEAGKPLPKGIDANFRRYITVTKKGG